MRSKMLPAFLSAFDLEALDRGHTTVVGLDQDLTIVWFNTAWERFAKDNDAADVLVRFGRGASYVGAIAGPLRGFYEAALSSALVTGKVFEQEYECSSPDTFRAYRMRALPVDGLGLLLEHSLLIDRPHEGSSMEAVEASYRQPSGLIVQCSNCRRVRRADGLTWDWIRPWVKSPPANTSHGMCTSCVSFYILGEKQHDLLGADIGASP